MLFTLGHYNALERIGAGGMGEVFRARDTKLGRTVAIKLLPEAIAGDQDRRDRFLREARAAAAISHPNVAMLFEVGEDASRLYLVFEHINGRTLGAAISGRPVAPRLALDLVIQIADGLADAHAAGLIHRDIKPDNIIVTPKEKAKILDFGLARWTAGGTAREMAATVSTTTTAPGVLLGTVAYMSPEQALGESLDPRTDIFSLGIVFYEMLTGRNPFASDAASAVLLNIAQRTPPPPSTINPDVPRELDPIVAKMLAKNPFNRYETAVALAAELRSVATMLAIRSGEAEPRVYGPVMRRRSGRRLVAAVALLAAIAAGAWWFGRDAARRVWREVRRRAAGAANRRPAARGPRGRRPHVLCRWSHRGSHQPARAGSGTLGSGTVGYERTARRQPGRCRQATRRRSRPDRERAAGGHRAEGLARARRRGRRRDCLVAAVHEDD